MKQHKVLVIEDDHAIRQGIVDALQYEGYAVIEAADGDDGLCAALGADFDVLLLDLVLPGRDGFAILQELRSKRPTKLVVILTARGDESDRVKGLRLGADDYVVKPFSVRELLARVEAVLRRSTGGGSGEGRVRFQGRTADFDRRVVEFEEGGSVELSERESALLRYLVINAGRPITRDELLARAWGLNAKGIETRTVDMHVARLREKLRDTPDQPGVIETVRGKGYILHMDAERMRL